MSKTIGNVVSIDEMLEKFGVDGTRYLLMSAGTFGEDVDMTMERMVEKYNADLANGLGNLLSRIIKMSEKLNHELKDYIGEKYEERTSTKEFYKINLEDINLCGTLVQIWEVLVRDDDKFIEENKPWELAKSDKDKFEKVMEKLILDLNLISELVIPFMPETSEKIKKALETKKAGILFPRIK